MSKQTTNSTMEDLSNAVKGGVLGDNIAPNNEQNSDNAASNSHSTKEWLKELPEELRGHKSLSKFNDQAALAKSYLELEKNFEKRIALPPEDASDDEWQKVFSKLGMPTDKKYFSDEKRAELIGNKLADNDTLSYYEDLFASSGLTKRQSEKLLQQIIDNNEANNKSYIEASNKERENNFANFQERHGDNAAEKLNILKAVIEEHGSDELTNLVEESNYSPVLIDLLLKLGDGVKSDSLITGMAQKPATSQIDARKEIKSLESDDKFMLIYNDRDHAGHKEALSRMNKLYELAYNKV